MIIIHGEEISQSRIKLDDILSEKKNIHRIDAKSLKTDDIPILLETNDLFETEKTIVIDNCKALSKQAFEMIVHLKPSKSTELIFWQGGNYDGRNIKKFPDAKVYKYELPKYFFTYLDGLLPGRNAQIHSVYLQLLKSYVPEQILFATIKRMRHLMLVKLHLESEYGELISMSSWQKNKLSQQARGWTLPQLQSFYTALYHTERSLKTSGMPTDLKNHLDNLILTELH